MPFDVTQFIQLAKNARELADGITQTAGKYSRNIDTDYLNQLILVLRSIYFSPNGICKILEILARGEKPSAAEIEESLVEFNQVEHVLTRNLDRIPWEFRRNDIRLSLGAEDTLRRIGWGKQGLREEIQSRINEPLTFDEPVDPREAAELLDKIKRLNASIHEAEDALRRIRGG